MKKRSTGTINERLQLFLPRQLRSGCDYLQGHDGGTILYLKEKQTKCEKKIFFGELEDFSILPQGNKKINKKLKNKKLLTLKMVIRVQLI